MWTIDFCTELGEEVETSFGDCPHCETDECLLHDWKDVAEYWREQYVELRKAKDKEVAKLSSENEQLKADNVSLKQLAEKQHDLALSDIVCCNCNDPLHKEDKALCYMCSLHYHDMKAELDALRNANEQSNNKLNDFVKRTRHQIEAFEKTEKALRAEIATLEKNAEICYANHKEIVNNLKQQLETALADNRLLVEQYNELQRRLNGQDNNSH